MRRVVLALGTGLGVGYVPFCPGTAGTLWGVLIYILVWPAVSNLLWHLIIAVFVLFLGVWVGGKCEKTLKDKDHRFIVIDEVGGFLFTVAGFPFSPTFLVFGFILFRLFDIIKPFHMGRLQNLPGGWGVVLDDVAAGLLANVLLRVLISMAGW